MRITINYGLSNSLTKEVSEGATLGSVIRDKTTQAALGYGDNVVGKIDGGTRDESHRLVDGDEVDVEVRANTKA